jgi:hypothetical protein
VVPGSWRGIELARFKYRQPKRKEIYLVPRS